MSLRKKLIILRYNFIALAVIYSLSFFSAGLALAEEESLYSYPEVDSEHCSIFFQGDINYSKLDRRVSVRFIDMNSLDKNLLKATNDAKQRLALKSEIILLRAEQILDMYPSDLHVNIIIFENTEKMLDAYQKVFGERKDLYSFYIYENNTIYTTQERLNQEVLAHELGHAIVNFYFIIRPPRDVRELISQYIDLHLED